MTMAQYIVCRREQGYELIRVKPVVRCNPLWGVCGTLAAVAGLKRRTLPGLALAVAGAAMIYRGSRGKVTCSKRVESGNTHDLEQDGEQIPTRNDPPEIFGPSYPHGGAPMARQIPEDAIDEASMQSFPASDAPAY